MCCVLYLYFDSHSETSSTTVKNSEQTERVREKSCTETAQHAIFWRELARRNLRTSSFVCVRERGEIKFLWQVFERFLKVGRSVAKWTEVGKRSLKTTKVIRLRKRSSAAICLNSWYSGLMANKKLLAWKTELVQDVLLVLRLIFVDFGASKKVWSEHRDIKQEQQIQG